MTIDNKKMSEYFNPENKDNKSFSRQLDFDILSQAHPDIQYVMSEFIKIKNVEFNIASTSIRTREQQIEFMNQGYTTTLNSHHFPKAFPELNNSVYICAVDMAISKVTLTNYGYDLYKVNSFSEDSSKKLLEEIEFSVYSYWGKLIDSIAKNAYEQKLTRYRVYPDALS